MRRGKRSAQPSAFTPRRRERGRDARDPRLSHPLPQEGGRDEVAGGCAHAFGSHPPTAHRPKRAVRRRVLGNRPAGDDDPSRIVGFNRGKTVVPGKTKTMRSHFIARLRARCRACGFTLVELMVTLAIAAILAMIAVPSFRNLILSNRLTTSANAMVDALNTARMDAIKLNATTQFCGSTANGSGPLATSCGAATALGAVVAFPQGATSTSVVRASSLNLD